MTPRYRLRTLLILLAILPPLLWIGWGKYEAWRTEKLRREEIRRMIAAAQAARPAKIQAIVAARIAAAIAELNAKAAARLEEVRVQEQMDDQAELDDLIRIGYLPAHAAPRIPPQPKAPAKAGE